MFKTDVLQFGYQALGSGQFELFDARVDRDYFSLVFQPLGDLERVVTSPAVYLQNLTLCGEFDVLIQERIKPAAPLRRDEQIITIGKFLFSGHVEDRPPNQI